MLGCILKGKWRIQYLEQPLNKQASVVLEGRVSLAQARALPLCLGEEEAECPHNLQEANTGTTTGTFTEQWNITKLVSGFQNTFKFKHLCGLLVFLFPAGTDNKHTLVFNLGSCTTFTRRSHNFWTIFWHLAWGKVLDTNKSLDLSAALIRFQANTLQIKVAYAFGRTLSSCFLLLGKVNSPRWYSCYCFHPSLSPFHADNKLHLQHSLLNMCNMFVTVKPLSQWMYLVYFLWVASNHDWTATSL